MYGNGIYGQNLFGVDVENGDNGEGYIDLMALLPEYHQDVVNMKVLQSILGIKVGETANSVHDLLRQCYITTATWGLDRWESILGITTDKSKSYERRREILLAKIRGSGTTTKDMIKSVAIAFSGGEVDVQEFSNEYRFVVQFIGIRGIPQNMAGLISAIEEIKPAHLMYSFKYTYTAWQQINMNWNQAKLKTWGDLRIYEGE